MVAIHGVMLHMLKPLGRDEGGLLLVAHDMVRLSWEVHRYELSNFIPRLRDSGRGIR